VLHAAAQGWLCLCYARDTAPPPPPRRHDPPTTEGQRTHLVLVPCAPVVGEVAAVGHGVTQRLVGRLQQVERGGVGRRVGARYQEVLGQAVSQSQVHNTLVGLPSQLPEELWATWGLLHSQPCLGRHSYPAARHIKTPPHQLSAG
jgi:hypothetical protein